MADYKRDPDYGYGFPPAPVRQTPEQLDDRLTKLEKVVAKLTEEVYGSKLSDLSQEVQKRKDEDSVLEIKDARIMELERQLLTMTQERDRYKRLYENHSDQYRKLEGIFVNLIDAVSDGKDVLGWDEDYA